MEHKHKLPFCEEVRQSTVGEIGRRPPAISPVQSIAIIVAKAVVRLIHRQKQLDSRTEQSVHDYVLVTKGETQ